MFALGTGVRRVCTTASRLPVTQRPRRWAHGRRWNSSCWHYQEGMPRNQIKLPSRIHRCWTRSSTEWELRAGLATHLPMKLLHDRCIVTQEFIALLSKEDRRVICQAIQRIGYAPAPFFKRSACDHEGRSVGQTCNHDEMTIVMGKSGSGARLTVKVSIFHDQACFNYWYFRNGWITSG